MRILNTFPRALLPSTEVVSGRALTVPLLLEADVVVVGSGAGGAGGGQPHKSSQHQPGNRKEAHHPQ